MMTTVLFGSRSCVFWTVYGVFFFIDLLPFGFFYCDNMLFTIPKEETCFQNNKLHNESSSQRILVDQQVAQNMRNCLPL